MWGLLYLAVGALAGALTWAYAVRESAVVFTSAMSAVLWGYLALVTEIEIVSGGNTVTITVGPVQWVWAAFALLATVALIGSILGVYPDTTDEQTFTEVSQ